MKHLAKILIVLLSLFSQSFCLCAENLDLKMGNDYLLTTDQTVKTIIVVDPTTLTATPFFTVSNDKNVILLQPKKTGKTEVNIIFPDYNSVINANVKDNKSSASAKPFTNKDVEVMVLDNPPGYEKIKPDVSKKTAPKGGK